MNKATLRKNFRLTLNALIELGRKACTNYFPKRVSFLKFYSLDYTNFSTILESRKAEYALLAQGGYEELDIIEEIMSRLTKGVFISWIDLTLFYVTDETTYIGVNIIESASETEIQFHCGIPLPPLFALEDHSNKFDLAEYINAVVSGN